MSRPEVATAPPRRRAALAAWVQDYLPLLKPRIIILLALYGVAAALVAGAGRVDAGRLLVFGVLALMAAGGAACLNHLFERETDALMQRTRSRPLPTGRVTPRSAARLAVILLGVSIPAAWLTLGGAVALQFVLGAAVYSGLYTLVLKPRTPWNIVIGGAAGAHGALAGWAVVDPSLGVGGWLLALVVFLWTPPHFWGLAMVRDADYRAAGIPMLPQVVGMGRAARAMTGYAAATMLASLLLVPVTPLGTAYAVVAALLGAAFTAACALLWRRPAMGLAWNVFKVSGMYLALLLLAMAVDVWM